MNSLNKILKANSLNKFICVGLDSDINKIPKHLMQHDNPLLEFNKIIIENTADYAAAFKLNFAFYEALGVKGLDILIKTLEFIPSDILTIGDAKRGDIGNTSEMYALSIYKELNFDSVTLNPYMGYDSVEPFLNYKDKLNFILALTSNKSSQDFENIKLEDGSYLYQSVINKVKEWNYNNNCGIVFGATKSSVLAENMNLIQNLPILLPGIGAQGGSLEDIINIFKLNTSTPFIINSSRGIIYKDNSINFGHISKEEIKSLNSQIELYFNS